MKKAVFLDRDGVLNRSMLLDGVPKPPKFIEDVEILEGVVEAIQILKRHGFIPVVVTNQPDVARGETTKNQVSSINSHIGNIALIEHFYTCFHDDVDKCICRKPLPGLILRAAKDLGLSLSESFLVGDRWRDIAAGQAAECKSFFIDYSYPEEMPKMPFTKVSSLLEAVFIMVGEQHGTK
jgi:D-glycero-D-manno-heptose 1,7-bisphosphate phosphatase